MIESSVAIFSLTLIRTATLIAVIPTFGGRNLPNLVKVGLAVALAGTLYAADGAPTTDSLGGMHSSWVWWGMAVIREVLIGGTLGVVCGLFLLPAQIAGAYLAQEMGLTMAMLTDPGSGSSISVPSQIFNVIGTLLFFGLDLHHEVFRALAFSIDQRPVGGDWALPSPQSVLSGFADAHEAGLLIAAPAGIILFVTLVVILITMRVAPQLNLFSYGLAVRIGAGLMATLIFLPEMCLLMNRMYLRLANMMAI